MNWPPSRPAAQGHVCFGAPSIRLFLVRLRPRRAELRFTGPNHRSKYHQFHDEQLTRSEVAIGVADYVLDESARPFPLPSIGIRRSFA